MRQKSLKCNRSHSFYQKQINLILHKRYSESEVRKFMEDPKVKVLTLHVSDKFGAYGLVGVVILINDKENAIIDTFINRGIRKES